MAEVILMPRLSDTMTEGVIAAWHKNIGDTVKKGDLLAEIETDKATMELESYQEGTVLHLGAPAGNKLQVNDLLAIIGNAGENVSALVSQHSGGANAAPAIQEAQPQSANTSTPTITANAASMEEVVLMPRLSDTMTEGVIAAWHKNVGDVVNKGEVLAEIETDKATMELESYKNGTLLYAGAKAGEKIAVNELLAIIGEPGSVNVEQIVASIKGGFSSSSFSVAENKEIENSNQPAVVNDGRILASPLAKKLASEKGLDLKYVKGSGDNGRIIKHDVDTFVTTQPAATVPTTTVSTTATVSIAPTVTFVQTGQESFEEVIVSQMRKTIAKRLAESKFSAPHFYLTMSINMDAAVVARSRINELSKVKISFNDMVLKAVSVALKQHPKINSSWLGDKIRINHHINIGVAVAVEEGLLVPVVRVADTKTLSQIAVEVKDFAQRAKDKKLQPADWEGSTFTISNLGMFGIDEFTAIINPPDACILAIGAINQIPVVKNGEIKPGNVMKVTLSCDHRAVDGSTGAVFLQTLKNLLEEPVNMLM